MPKEDQTEGKVPIASKDLLDYLRKIFPDRLPTKFPASLDEVHQRMGAQIVIRKLESDYEASGQSPD